MSLEVLGSYGVDREFAEGINPLNDIREMEVSHDHIITSFRSHSDIRMTVGKPRTFLFLDLPLPSSPLLVGKRLNLANCTINSNISASLFCSLAAIGFAFMFMQSKILYCALKRLSEAQAAVFLLFYVSTNPGILPCHKLILHLCDENEITSGYI